MHKQDTLKDWFTTNNKAYSSAFEIILVEKGIEYQIAYKNKEIKLL